MKPCNYHQPTIEAAKDPDPLQTAMQNQIGYPNLAKMSGEEGFNH
jgi:hypothetical protein